MSVKKIVKYLLYVICTITCGITIGLRLSCKPEYLDTQGFLALETFCLGVIVFGVIRVALKFLGYLVGADSD